MDGHKHSTEVERLVVIETSISFCPAAALRGFLPFGPSTAAPSEIYRHQNGLPQLSNGNRQRIPSESEIMMIAYGTCENRMSPVPSATRVTVGSDWLRDRE